MDSSTWRAGILCSEVAFAGGELLDHSKQCFCSMDGTQCRLRGFVQA